MSGDFASPTGIDWNPGNTSGQVRFGDDSKMVCIFYWKSVQNVQASAAQNTPIFENVAYVRMHPPGERLMVVDRPATDEDRYRFPRQWNQFVRKQAQIPEGTPVDILFPNNPAYADMLKGHGIWTIQQLSNLSASAVEAVGMGAQEAVNKAQRYLKESGDSKATQDLNRKLDEKDHEINVLRKQLSMQKKQIDELFVKVGSMGPTVADLNPVTSRDYDPQTERINNNHVTKELAVKKGKKTPLIKPAPPKEELEHVSILNQVKLEEVEEPFDL